MKMIVVPLALLGLLVLGSRVSAEICTLDNVPAATLLVPYFEVDFKTSTGITTLISVNNASAFATLAHVTLWTDESIPTLDFDIYLTGYDVQTINLRDVFNGVLPRTADAGADPGNISNQGPLSQDSDFPGSSGPCGTASTLYPAAPNAALSPSLISNIRNSHTGLFSSVYGGCLGLNYGDNIARGYITVDSVKTCDLRFPSDPGYFSGPADNRNILWGDYFYADVGENLAQGETMVHIEACPSPRVGQGADDCPFTAGDYTFYGRHVGGAAIDQREPLSTNFAARFANGGIFDAGTDLIVWRDSKVPVGVTIPAHSCTVGRFPWVPLNQADVVAFDEAENPQDLCFQGDNISPPAGGSETCFPVEAQRVNLISSAVPFGSTPAPPTQFGWMFLNLNTTVTGQAPALPKAVAQAWVTMVSTAEGLLSFGHDAIQLDTVCDNLKGGTRLLP